MRHLQGTKPQNTWYLFLENHFIGNTTVLKCASFLYNSFLSVLETRSPNSSYKIYNSNNIKYCFFYHEFLMTFEQANLMLQIITCSGCSLMWVVLLRSCGVRVSNRFRYSTLTPASYFSLLIYKLFLIPACDSNSELYFINECMYIF